MKKALITGITGQDGSYLAELLLKENYEVHGIVRRASVENTGRIQHLVDDNEILNRRLFLHQGDLTDSVSMARVIDYVMPNEIYNLAAQSHVGVSFAQPEYTADVSGVGALRLLESVRLLGLSEHVKFYQASTSELFGQVQEVPQNESTPFYPRSPYGIAKLYAYWLAVNYREAYDIYACNGILFNHESPRRGKEFVTRKITSELAKIKVGQLNTLRLGNLDAKRDWGHARDFVRMQWLMLQQETARDYVIATGQQHSVRDFVQLAAAAIEIDLRWEGEGLNEKGFDASGNCIIEVDKTFFRPAEVETLLGDASKAKAELGWEPLISFQSLVEEMALSDLRSLSSSS